MLEFLPVDEIAPAAFPKAARGIPWAGDDWNTSCLDWEERLLEGQSLVPHLPLFEAEAALGLRCFKRLRLPDVIGTPTLEEVCGPWVFPIVAALFGSYDSSTNVRHISELFLLIPKGNSKSSTGGAIMGTDPRTSAVNRYLQSWDVHNVFVPGASAFPQGLGYNPTGLVAALTYWSAKAIRERYLQQPGALA